MATALYPGGFKPPHRGHFEVVKKLLSGTHNGKVYNFIIVNIFHRTHVYFTLASEFMNWRYNDFT